jgi:hypothetical protein
VVVSENDEAANCGGQYWNGGIGTLGQPLCGLMELAGVEAFVRAEDFRWPTAFVRRTVFVRRTALVRVEAFVCSGAFVWSAGLLGTTG